MKLPLLLLTNNSSKLFFNEVEVDVYKNSVKRGKNEWSKNEIRSQVDNVCETDSQERVTYKNENPELFSFPEDTKPLTSTSF